MSDKPREFWHNWMGMAESLDAAKDDWPKSEWVDLKCYVEKSEYDALAAENERLRVENNIMLETLIVYADFKTWNRGWDGNTPPETMAINALKLIGDWPK